MAIWKKPYKTESYPYRVRFLSSLVVILFTIQLLIRFWPGHINSTDRPLFNDSSPFEAVEEVLITTQQISRAIAPSKPVVQQLPPEVKEETLLPEIPEISSLLNLDSLFSQYPPLTEGMGKIEANPDRPAVPLRIVEPELGFTLPDGIQGKIRVEVLFVVTTNGKVESVAILATSQVDTSNTAINDFIIGQQEQLIIGAVQRAASQWSFKPAEKNGIPVNSEFKSTFRI
jgi:hypothetical protein